MAKWTRRNVLKTTLAATAGALAARPETAPADTLRGEADERAAPPQVAAAPAPGVREMLSLDRGWRFHLGHADDPALDFGFGAIRREATYAKANYAGAVTRARFDDSGWRQLDLPHDWAVELPFQNDPGLPDHGGKPLGRIYPASSIGWYRRPMEIPPGDLGRRIALVFEGLFRDATVFFNGERLGRNFSGYCPARFDLTDLALYGQTNILTVRVDATLGEGWFYEGAGIYRHAWLEKTGPLHFAPQGVFARSESISPAAADVVVRCELENDTADTRRCRVYLAVRGAAGENAASGASREIELAPFGRGTVETRLRMPRPELWSPHSPHLYALEARLEEAAASAPADAVTVSFGVRSLRFDADRGFFLNGEHLKIQGTCDHQDHAGVGSAVPDALQTYRIACLKRMGANALRTSHNFPTPALLEACDRLGMLVMAETRMMASTPEGLSQVERLVRWHRNHPSVFIWSLGNEEPQQSTPVGARVIAGMKRRARQLDPSRPVTVAMNGGWTPEGISSVVDVQGCNYNESRIDDFHRRNPRQPMIGTETASALATRGIYFTDRVRGYVTAYDTNAPSYAKTAEQWWKFYAARDFLAGGFAWTGFDYRGEPSPYEWPCISSHFGIVDTCGFPKDTYYYYRAWWSGEPVLHLFPHWNWAGREGQLIPVWCHSNCDEVELFLDGKSLGARAIERWGHAEWSVPYAPGRLEARGRHASGLTLTDVRETTGAAAALAAHADRTVLSADGADAAVIAIEVRDARGRIVPTAANLVRFAVSGPGRVIGVGNGDPSSHEPDRASQRSAFNGLCMAIVQTTGEAGAIEVTAAADGLAPATVTLRSAKT